MRVVLVADIVMFHKPPDVRALIGQFCRHLKRAYIAGCFKNAPQQDRFINRASAGAGLNLRQYLVHQIGIWAIEIIEEIKCLRHHNSP